MNDSALDRQTALFTWKRLCAGETVLVDDRILDELTEHFRDQDSVEAGLFFNDLVTVDNPKRVGIRDQYLARLQNNPTS